ncbi:hypothetical protein M434DRAFT_34334 [Hypoxylon sp. CO27-5]|nr:hypothetical protein M434DRAFT_34334 [Hypoxylon sp. CO27-5]
MLVLVTSATGNIGRFVIVVTPVSTPSSTFTAGSRNSRSKVNCYSSARRRRPEKAGVKRFVAACWNYDQTALKLGQHESFDLFIAFHNHIELTSEIRSIYILTGVSAEVFFAVSDHGDFSPRNHRCWDPQRKRLEIWGRCDEPWHWATERNTTKFAAGIVQCDDATEGEYCVSVRVSTPGKNRCHLRGVMGTVTDLREWALQARREGSRRNFWSYIGWL